VISAIVFSKDRACQLDFLLTSLIQKGNELFDISVLYEHSNDSFKAGYSRLKEKYPSLNWVEETDFQKDTTDLITKGGDLVCFFVDDNILYRKIEADEEVITKLFDNRDVFCLSLRLGANTIIQNEYVMQECVIPLRGEFVNETFLVWNWIAQCEHCRAPLTGNYAYPFSVDGHIFKKSLVEKLLLGFDEMDERGVRVVNHPLVFDTPNAFEGRIWDKGWEVSVMPKKMSSFQESMVVNIPLNLVGSSENMSGQKFGVSLEELNQKYLAGSDPDLDNMDFSNVQGCHQEIQLKFKEVANVRSS